MSRILQKVYKKITGEEFTDKDFRTWSGTIRAYQVLKEMMHIDQVTGSKKKVVTVLDTVSDLLGNTRNVCKKYYVHPILLSKFEAGEFDKYLVVPSDKQVAESDTDLSADEKLVLKILESN